VEITYGEDLSSLYTSTQPWYLPELSIYHHMGIYLSIHLRLSIYLSIYVKERNLTTVPISECKD